MEKYKILIAEDEAIIALNIKEMLETKDFEVAGITSKGEEAVKMALNLKPDLILMDIRLSGKMDGITAYEKIKALSDIPVIYLTSHSDEMTLKRAKNTEPEGYILKPLNQQELFFAIELAIYKHKTGKKLKESENRYRVLVNNSRTGIWETTPQGYTIYVNRAMLMMLEIEDESEIIGKKYDSFFTPKSLETIKEAHKKRKNGIISWYEAEIIGKKGTKRFVEISDAPILNDKGKIESIIGTIVDITERKKALKELETNKEELQAAIEELTQTNEEFEAANEELLQTQAELIKASEELAKSEEKYKEFVEGTEDIITQVDKKGKFLFVNSKSGKFFGIPPEECIGLSAFSFIHPEDREDTKNKFKDYIEKKVTAGTFENRQVSRDGKVYHIMWKSHFHYNEKGELIFANSIGKDITELKEAEEKYRTLSENSPAAVFKFLMSKKDGSFSFPFITKRIKELSGVDAESIMKDSSALLNMIHPDYREEFARGVLESAKNLKEYSEEIRFVKDNEERWAKVKGIPELLPNGDIIWNGFLEDITERKRAEERLRESEEKFRSITEKSVVGVYLIQDGKFRYVNPRLAEIFGYSIDEIIDKLAPADLTYSEDQPLVQENIKKRETGEEDSINYAFRALKKNGDIIRVEVFGTRMQYNGKPAVIGTIHDITRRIKAEEELKTSLQEKETLLKEIHHRVKNNMQIISSLIELQSSFITEKTGVDYFRETTGRIKSMALVHEKIYHSENLSEIDFKEYINTLSAEIFRSFVHKECEIDIVVNIKDITLNIEKAIPCGLIINELITNSYKHAFPAQKKGTVKIDFRPDRKGNYHLTVSDNGAGLTKDFDFSKGNTLGFQLVNALTEQLQGEIKLLKGKGAIFRITFPEK